MKSLATQFAALRHALVFANAEDKAEFYTYPPDEQTNVRVWWDAMMQIAGARNRHQGCIEVANAHRGHKGWSRANVRAIYDAWNREDKSGDAKRDWRELVDKRRFPDAKEPPLPEEFRAHIRAKFSSNQRVNSAPHRQIIRQWEAWWTTGDPRYRIPGYDVCPPPGPNGRHPRGWSYENCNRHAPPKAELAIARIGVHAGIALLPGIPGTREGVRFLEWVSGDDVWLKRKAMVLGYGPCRVVQFGLMDYGASYYLDRFIQRPAIPRRNTRGGFTDEQLKRRDFLWCVALHLEEYGYPLDYKMHIILEHGTATMSAAEARFLWEVSEGQIVCCYNTMDGGLVHAWEERKAGRSNAKAWHESFHNLYANEEADLPGQTGKDRDHSPAALQGRERHAMALQRPALILPPAERARLMLPFPGMKECREQSMVRVQWCNERRQHDCEGFETVFDWRPRGFPALPRPEGELPAWLAQNPRVDPARLEEYIELFPRPESPAERVLRISHGYRFEKLAPSVWRRFYEDLHISEPVDEDGRVSFVCKETGRKCWFEPETVEQAVKPGTKVTGFYRPDGSALHIFDSTDRHLLTWRAVKPNRRDNAVGKQADFARSRSFLNEALANVREATAEEVETAQAAYDNNTTVLAENGLIKASDELPPVAAAVQEVTERKEGKEADTKRQANANRRAKEKREADALRVGAAMFEEVFSSTTPPTTQE